MEIYYIDNDKSRPVEVFEWQDIGGNFYGWCHNPAFHKFFGWSYILATRLFKAKQ